MDQHDGQQAETLTRPRRGEDVEDRTPDGQHDPAGDLPGRGQDLFESIASLKHWLDGDGNGDEPRMIGKSGPMRRVFARASKYARSGAPVLVTGESGTGKEGLARFMHRASSRREKSYARVNCAALSEGVLESELFGHERGAFTGALARRIGRFEWAAGGTLLLDEISEIPLPLQAKLLRVLEEAEFQRVGGNETITTDVRILATSNRRLQTEVARGTFRADLYYRVNVLELKLPPLRQRREDIPELAMHFLARFRHESATPITSISDEVMHALCDYPWPGNVRELRNTMHRACVLATDGIIRMDQIAHLRDDDETSADVAEIAKMKLKDAERHLILAALAKHDGNKTAAARDLGVTSRTLQNKMQRYRELGFLA